MSKNFTAEEYRRFIDDMKGAIDEQKLSITKAAKVLGVTRQTLHSQFVAQPKHQLRWRTVGRAARAWDLVVYVQGEKFDKGAFGEEPGAEATAVQLLLRPDTTYQVPDTNLEISVVRKRPGGLVVEIRSKAAG